MTGAGLETPIAIGGPQDSTKAPFSDLQVFIVLLAMLLLCYISVLVTKYGFADDYFVLWAELTGSHRLKVEFASGRPLQGILEYLAFSRIRGIGDLGWLRFLSVILIATVAWLVYHTLLRAGWNWWSAFFFAVINATLPAFQVLISVSFLWDDSLAVVLAALAFYLAEWSWEEPRSGRKWGFATGSVLTLFLSIVIFQPAAMYFWVLAAVVMFRPGAKVCSLLDRLVWYAPIAGAGLFLGFGVYELGIATFPLAQQNASRSHLNTDVLRKLQWFVKEPLVNACNLLNIRPDVWFACLVALVGCAGLLFYFRGSIKERVGKLAIALSLIPICYLPNLITAENWASYRTQVALTSLVLLYLTLAICGYLSLLPDAFTDPVLNVGPPVAAFAALLLAAYTVQTYFALPQSLDLQLMRSQLAAGNLGRAGSIYVIGSSRNDHTAPAARYDEFGVPSSSKPWAPGPTAHILLGELDRSGRDIPVNVVLSGGVIDPPPGALVVDMRRLARFR